ncbi:hypothetical protein [Variovorax rhizosphaerae]|uniref:Uncharacterized protein n=1 Tax=Variovorax rhizosphaerae TaxID=1836200 RepID=A0ABU8WXJ0_9BURK
MAVLQLVPYRSREFGHHKLIRQAPSSAAAVALVRHLERQGDKLLIVQRQITQWGFRFPSDRPNVIVYDPLREALKASLSLISPRRAGHLAASEGVDQRR